MVENCQYTCGQCKQADNAPECKDTYEQSCWRWKEDGKCESDAQQELSLNKFMNILEKRKIDKFFMNVCQMIYSAYLMLLCENHGMWHN